MEAADQIAQVGDKLMDAAGAAIELYNNSEKAAKKGQRLFWRDRKSGRKKRRAHPRYL